MSGHGVLAKAFPDQSGESGEAFRLSVGRV
jgi:hypothetical protein